MISTDKAQEIDYIIQSQLGHAPEKKKRIEREGRVHLLRSIFVAIDMTQSMGDKDFKPSRLSITLKAVKDLIKQAKDTTPLCKFLVAIVENEMCKPIGDFSFEEDELIEKVNKLTIKADCGNFSLQNTLAVALEYFENIPNTYNKQLIIFQSSPYTKDYKDIYERISIFKASNISISIISLTGSTFVYEKLAEACNGEYITVGSENELEDYINKISKPPKFNPDKVIKKLVKMAFVKRMYTENKKCFCHGIKQEKQFFLCGVCAGVLCGKMPMECPICMSILVFPSDLFRFNGEGL